MAIVSSFVGAGTDAGFEIAVFVQEEYSTEPINQQRWHTLVLVIPLLATNILATSLIGYKASVHSRDIRKNLSQCGNTVSRTRKVLFLLVESGIIYCMLWVTYMIISLMNDNQTLAFATFSTAMPSLTALYPLFIILVVSAEMKKDGDQYTNQMSLSQSMRFAPAVQTAASFQVDEDKDKIEIQEVVFAEEDIQEVPIQETTY
ncbi:hypothetical protein D9758_018074 [Tetrapyrgos nigripes]|uniref:G protein-coupled receptor n=1 Tax=Tetrapyrgos nigripes TaxID=182062 RepID=A0A8H5FFN1_9AGAR|nr:hypothetical protein D9758_018074 [Tetrapyrgos nigripes]